MENTQVLLNIVWTMVGAFLVYFMQAGFAMVETGFTRAKNSGNILMKNMMDSAMGHKIQTGEYRMDPKEPAWICPPDYEYEIIESNGHLAYDNSLLEDDVLSFRPYYMEQKSSSAAAVELNTMRLMEDRPTRFVVTEKSTGKKVFNINLTDFLALTSMEGNNMDVQEYLDRQDRYKIIFFFADNTWNAVQVNINGWTWYLQSEGI